ncbi:hypothetical protein HJD18_03410 [Thermoleophilia bacterium SCSIO 60948]|nr:hypothetical protein HJD18_03410 [Thermoleophilia bacterium SCSIO 60948]
MRRRGPSVGWRAWIPRIVTAVSVVGLALCCLRLVEAEIEPISAAEATGIVIGTILFPLLVVGGIRFIYARFIEKGTPLWSAPWLLSCTLLFVALSLPSRIDQIQADYADEVVGELDAARDNCEARGVEALPDLPAPYAYRPLPQRVESQFAESVPTPLAENFEAASLVGRRGETVWVFASPVGGLDEASESASEETSQIISAQGGTPQTSTVGESTELTYGEIGRGAVIGSAEGACHVRFYNAASLPGLKRAVASISEEDV